MVNKLIKKKYIPAERNFQTLHLSFACGHLRYSQWLINLINYYLFTCWKPSVRSIRKTKSTVIYATHMALCLFNYGYLWHNTIVKIFWLRWRSVSRTGQLVIAHRLRQGRRHRLRVRFYVKRFLICISGQKRDKTNYI